MFPNAYKTTLKGADALHKLSKQGLVNVSDLSKRITAGRYASPTCKSTLEYGKAGTVDVQSCCQCIPKRLHPNASVLADIISEFAFEEEMGNLALEQNTDGHVSFAPRPEIQVCTYTASCCFDIHMHWHLQNLPHAAPSILKLSLHWSLHCYCLSCAQDCCSGDLQLNSPVVFHCSVTCSWPTYVCM